jgi:hypothetical protein
MKKYNVMIKEIYISGSPSSKDAFKRWAIFIHRNFNDEHTKFKDGDIVEFRCREFANKILFGIIRSRKKDSFPLEIQMNGSVYFDLAFGKEHMLFSADANTCKIQDANPSSLTLSVDKKIR